MEKDVTPPDDWFIPVILAGAVIAFLFVWVVGYMVIK